MYNARVMVLVIIFIALFLFHTAIHINIAQIVTLKWLPKFRVYA